MTMLIVASPGRGMASQISPQESVPKRHTFANDGKRTQSGISSGGCSEPCATFQISSVLRIRWRTEVFESVRTRGRGSRRQNRRLRVPSEKVCLAGLMRDKGLGFVGVSESIGGCPSFQMSIARPSAIEVVPKRHTTASVRMG
jgi:hypothetical protein